MKAFMRAFFASLLAIVTIIVLIVAVAAVKSSHKAKIHGDSYLIIDLRGGLLEYDPPTEFPSGLIGGESETLQRILDNLEMAALDSRIDGIIVKFSGNAIGGATTQEIRGRIKALQATGKQALAYADIMNRNNYYLASACDSIFMPPSAYFEFTGLSATSMHVKNALRKLEIEPHLDQIREYKSAAELILREDMSTEAKQNAQWMMDEVWEMFTAAVYEDRQIDANRVTELMQSALFTPQEAEEAGLIDGVRYWDEIEQALTQEGEEDFHSVSQDRYAQEPRKKFGLAGKKHIAVIHAQGMIGGRDSRVDPLLGIIMGHESVAEELERVRRDDDISAVVFRVDSPGGTSLTSDLIGHAVELTATQKPVVVSAVDVAASGGYSISYRATKIVADPGSVVGSIGSISGKFNISKLHERLGITHDFVEKGPMALFHSPYKSFTDEEWERFTANHWADFQAWVQDIAQHRDMTEDKLDSLVYGRVWTGRQAKQNGLIDEVGGLDRAIEIAKELAGIPAEEAVTIDHYPEKKDLLDMITGGGGDLAAVVRLFVYRFIREDVEQTWSVLAHHHEVLTGVNWRRVF